MNHLCKKQNIDGKVYNTAYFTLLRMVHWKAFGEGIAHGSCISERLERGCRVLRRPLPPQRALYQVSSAVLFL
jgi:hypothetical protein